MAILEEFSTSQAEKNRVISESRHDVLRIHPKRLASIWTTCFPLLMKSMPANSQLTVADIIAGLADQSMQFWIIARREESVIDAVFLTSIERDKGEWVLSLFNLGGTGAREWVGEVHRMMHQYARLEDCKRVRMCGRPAWQRILPNYPVVGERLGHLIYERRVED